MKLLKMVVLFWLSSVTVSFAGAETQLEATHNELRALRDGLLEAMNKGDIERQLSYLHTNVVITWHNAEVSRGREGVRAYFNKMTGGPDKLVDKFSAEVTVEELTILYGDDTGISFGSSIEHFKLTSGRSFDLKGRWTATLVKENGHWLIASLHVSTNIFDNTLLNLAKRSVIWVALLSLVVGMITGWLLTRKRKP